MARDMPVTLPSQCDAPPAPRHSSVATTAASAQQSDKVLAALRADAPDVQLRRTEFVGPQVGEELVTNGLYALAADRFPAMVHAAGCPKITGCVRFERDDGSMEGHDGSGRARSGCAGPVMSNWSGTCTFSFRSESKRALRPIWYIQVRNEVPGRYVCRYFKIR